MSPVAESNLHGFYARASRSTEDLKTMRTFFGCLANAVAYLHSNSIRHRDIKPENILVKGSTVYLTDFGISLCWENLSRSTTITDPSKTPRYCAPEVANNRGRNESSDIWSLGCVFLELCTILKGRTLEDMRRHFGNNSNSPMFWENPPAIASWSAVLRNCGSKFDNHPIEWSISMLQIDPSLRPKASSLRDTTSRCKTKLDRGIEMFCGHCCLLDDEDESSVDLDSDGELWADDRDDQVNSPSLTQSASIGHQMTRITSEHERDHQDASKIQDGMANLHLVEGSSRRSFAKNKLTEFKPSIQRYRQSTPKPTRT